MKYNIRTLTKSLFLNPNPGIAYCIFGLGSILLVLGEKKLNCRVNND